MAPLSLEFGIAGSVAPGQRVSGDLEVVRYYNHGGGVLIAAIDGIGHGEEAAASARLAADILLRQPEEKLGSLLMRCHAALRGTRGVVLSIASIDLRQAAMSWLGIGNVSGIVLRGGPHESYPREELLVRPGVLGYGDLGRSHIPVDVRSSITQRLPPAVETALYRVVQEALTNAARHSKASRIRIEIDQELDTLRCVISDDGVGFEVESCVRRGGLGLRGMRERLAALGGSLHIVSAPGKGAQIRFQLPLGKQQ